MRKQEITQTIAAIAAITAAIGATISAICEIIRLYFS